MDRMRISILESIAFGLVPKAAEVELDAGPLVAYVVSQVNESPDEPAWAKLREWAAKQDVDAKSESDDDKDKDKTHKTTGRGSRRSS